jgi:hypothetical protein
MTEQAAEGVAVDYWQTPSGVLDRFGMLADDIQLGTFNDSVKTFATAYGATDFRKSGSLKLTSCQWCTNHVGAIYHRGQFMPDLPRHPGCPHYYDILRTNEPLSERALFANP